MRIGALLVVVSAVVACSGGGLFRQYEYEEEMYLSLDGSATVYVNSSIFALNALRGSTFDARPNARVDRAAVRAYFSTPVTRVVRVSSSRRRNRRFVHVRLEVADVRRLPQAGPFAWSSYRLETEGELVAYGQAVGASAGGDAGPARWNSDEVVAFRLHLPSRIVSHNSPTGAERGNIVRWEQPLAERLAGTSVAMDVRMERRSILARTLVLFGVTMLAVAATFAVAIWWVVRRAPRAKAGGH